MLEIIKAILLGIIQGITEWLPVSSTGHMILFNHWFPLSFSKEFVDLFLVFIQLGSIIAVIVLFFNKLFPWSSSSKSHQHNTILLWVKIIIAAFPGAIIGLLFDDIIDTVLYKPIVIAITLIVYGVLFIYIEKTKKDHPKNTLSLITYKDALLIGAFQVLALIPGTSRSGATILGAIVLGASRTVAAEFSFFLAIPMMFGASFIKLIKAGFTWSSLEWTVLATGTIVAFVVSLLVIRFLMDYVKKHDFTYFAYYRIALALVVLTLLFI
ncbi:MAG TPA: undecaprenyl-diphosphate phosphatase [Erysipelotrichaceae bacterium]|nr:undecaprenyl-diphosphate phosphatase [Erysipelotrichaceae bacterium]